MRGNEQSDSFTVLYNNDPPPTNFYLCKNWIYDKSFLNCNIFFTVDSLINKIVFFSYRAVTDPRDGRRVALKKLPNVFQSLVSSKRVFRELKMLCFFKHENVSENFEKKFLYFRRFFCRNRHKEINNRKTRVTKWID